MARWPWTTRWPWWCGFALLRQVGRVAGGDLFLDLQEERVLGAIALHEDAVVAQADGAGADDLEGDVERGVLREEVLALGLQALGVGGERVEHVAGGLAVNAGQVGRVGFEDAGCAPVRGGRARRSRV